MAIHKFAKQSYNYRALLMRESERKRGTMINDQTPSSENHFQSSRINSIDAKDSEAAVGAANNTLIIPHPQGGPAFVAFCILKFGCS